MTAEVTQIWRHPLKSHGREALEDVSVSAGQTMPGDRVWAVAHEASSADGSQWVSWANFTRGAKAPRLMAINSAYDEAAGLLTLTHPDRPDLTFNPDDPADHPRFLEWEKPLLPENRAGSSHIVRVPGRGMTDTEFPSISLANWASHRAVEHAIGHELSAKRWRSNIWFDLGEAWVENTWLGREVQIGETVLAVRERAVRCLATAASPETGERDADTLKTLNDNWGHQDFSVYAEVVRGGRIRLGDKVQVL
ncbi:MOSC domain-containing protein [Leisingera sp. ANG-Vp]|uniref:MOSC domain-containing protein n=1 Tax=Leisingera sp. ANG-Vp TaxID=1577896 RepID=UPI00057E1D92|nr:MOSC N-terminal beta barrel domain-containing protein [Leisingera sp. ANG-Vp]KIC15177.1 molybdenum cofactor biosysynthesis protein [Leisingera sp. ANG-Vp]